MLISEQAATLSLADFQREYESKVCAACGQEKWRLYPFCRSCSIKLQRAHLMKWMVEIVAFDGKREIRNWSDITLRMYWRHYDRCRDFLINTRKQKEAED